MGEYMAQTNQKIVKVVTDSGPLGWLAFTAYIGAVVFLFIRYLNFWGFIMALIKAAFWPAYVIFEAMKALGVG